MTSPTVFAVHECRSCGRTKRCTDAEPIFRNAESFRQRCPSCRWVAAYDLVRTGLVVEGTEVGQ
ncbi:hypothetical protein [Halolamina sp.]|uniref:hypothetical protein n=1 Tax=Halolamina sp. TaxID=1940283 RepID=UPI0035620904